MKIQLDKFSTWQDIQFQPENLPFILEMLIDRAGAYKVVAAIETVCAEKAQHIEENYPDQDNSALVDDWNAMSSDLATTLSKAYFRAKHMGLMD